MPRTYSEKQSRRMVVFAVLPLVAALTAKVALRALGVDDGGWLALSVILAAFCAFFLLGAQFWKGLDDMHRQGHAVSWYWGSMGGLAVTACIIAATGLARSEFMLGVATLIVMQLVCSSVLYAIWLLKGRGFSFRSGK
ncbi:hypothetical protein OAS19_00920 [Altererythrobacter sp.]|nr:hypothetical protein [Altererythrobacter sp.]